MSDHLEQQRELCRRHQLPFVAAANDSKVGIARNVLNGLLPINGLRHPPSAGSSGWYIWAGEEMGKDPDFFVPLHVAHLEKWCPTAVKYLGLPPGSRFLAAGAHEDVWSDPALLDV